MSNQNDLSDRDRLVADIIGRELSMFLTVPADGIYSCQQDPDGFRLHRGAQFSIWSEETLLSYQNDLIMAEKEGLNLMTVKYARMENQIPCQNQNPLIDAIAAIQIQWQVEMGRKYPNMMAAARPVSDTDEQAAGTSFETYLRGELETYSNNTLFLLHRDFDHRNKKGHNGSEQIYTHLVQSLGYPDLETAEASQKSQ